MSKFDIQYRPKDGYKKNYDMEGQYDSSGTKQYDDKQNKLDKKIKDLMEDINDISDLIDGLQKPLQSIITTPVSGIRYVINMFEPNLDDIERSGIEITVPDDIYANNGSIISNNNLDDNNDIQVDLFPDLPDIGIEVIKGDGPEEKIKKQFQKDLINIFDDFSQKLKSTLSNYYTALLKTAKDSGIDNYLKLQNPFEVDSSKIKNKFLSDSIIKSQIVRDQKQRLISKFFDIDEMISIIRKCKVAEQLKIRYYATQYDEKEDYLKVNKNMVLSNARQEYDKKYKENLYGLYKCLNSVVILLDECLQQSLMESQCKAILFKEEGIKI